MICCTAKSDTFSPDLRIKEVQELPVVNDYPFSPRQKETILNSTRKSRIDELVVNFQDRRLALGGFIP